MSLNTTKLIFGMTTYELILHQAVMKSSWFPQSWQYLISSNFLIVIIFMYKVWIAINPIRASFHMLFSYFSCPPSVNCCFIFFAHSSITLPGLLLFVYTMSLYFNFLLIVYIPNIFARSICSVLHETEIVKFDVINYTIFFLMVYAFFPHFT